MYKCRVKIIGTRNGIVAVNQQKHPSRKYFRQQSQCLMRDNIIVEKDRF